MDFFRELKRRNVYKVAIAYVIFAWLIIQVVTQTFPFFEIPNWAVRLVILLLIASFPIAVIIGWAFELTPEGIKRTDEAETEAAGDSSARPRSRAWLYFVVVAALLSIGLFFLGRFTADRTSGSTGAAGKSIAVLPFTNLSEDKANAYFADGIQDEILTRLSKIGALKVISRTSTEQYQSKPGNLAEIAKQLGVAHILEGSVQKAGQSVRVNVQLIKADSDSHLWAETYDRKLTDIFAVESEVAQRIADSLRAKLTGQEKAAISYVGTNVPAAYDAYLRAIAIRNSQSREDQERFIKLCRQTVALDPNYAAAWADLSVAEGLKYLQGERTEAQKTLAREAAEKALRLDPDHGNGHAAMGMYLYYCLQEYDQALAELEKAREQAPGDPMVIQGIGLINRRQGKLEESIKLQLQVAQIDPLNEDNWVNLGWTYRGMRRFADARSAYNRALSIAPGDGEIGARRAENEAAAGNLQVAISAIRDVAPVFGTPSYGGLISALEVERKYDEAIAKLTTDLKEASSRPGLPRLAVPRAHLTLGALQREAGRPAEAQRFFAEAEEELAALRAEGNNSPQLRAALLECYASLGRRAEVERMAAEHTASQGKDRWTGPLAEEDAARAFCLVGDFGRALDLLEKLMGQSYADSITPALLRIDPVWDAMRENPRFQKLAGVRP
ncbi:MAG TPA: tetratricopeptide repeat protein [Chthoniobacterales bacterium]|jgi:TolB-like protein/Tfp pilus assembly protein PilF